MINPYTKLLLVCDAAEQFIVASKDPSTLPDNFIGILSCLISAEDILDHGRSLVPAGAGFEFAEDKQKVNERMDAIRSEIVSLMQQIGKKDAVELLEYRSRQGRLQWANSL